MRSLVNALKQLTWFYVIDHPDLVSVQTGQRARIKQNADRGAYDERTACYAGAVIDFIASMDRGGVRLDAQAALWDLWECLTTY